MTSQDIITLIDDLRAAGHDVACPVTGTIQVDGVDVTSIAKEHTPEEALEAIHEALLSEDVEEVLPEGEYWIRYELTSETSEATHDDITQGRLPEHDTLAEIIDICVAHQIDAQLSNAAGFPAGRVESGGNFALNG